MWRRVWKTQIYFSCQSACRSVSFMRLYARPSVQPSLLSVCLFVCPSVWDKTCLDDLTDVLYFLNFFPSGLHTGSYPGWLGRVCPKASLPGEGRGTVHLRRFTPWVFELPSCQSRGKGREWTLCSVLEKNVVRKAQNRPHRKGSCVLNGHIRLAVKSNKASQLSRSITRWFAWHQNN